MRQRFGCRQFERQRRVPPAMLCCSQAPQPIQIRGIRPANHPATVTGKLSNCTDPTLADPGKQRVLVGPSGKREPISIAGGEPLRRASILCILPARISKAVSFFVSFPSAAIETTAFRLVPARMNQAHWEGVGPLHACSRLQVALSWQVVSAVLGLRAVPVWTEETL